MEPGCGAIGPTRNLVKRGDSAGTVIEDEEVHRKDGVSHPVGAALLCTEERLQSNNPGLTLSPATESLCPDLSVLNRKGMVLVYCQWC